MDVFDLSPKQRADRLLEFGTRSLGDMRPSRLMDEMLGLLGGHRPCLLFESLFLKSMPEDVRMQLAMASFDDPRALAKIADALWQARGQPSLVSAADNRSPPTSDNRAPRNARPRATDRPIDICYYHRRFGNAARKCNPPCTFTGNEGAGRQQQLRRPGNSTACRLQWTITQPSVSWLTREHPSACFLPRTRTDTVVYARLPLSLPTGPASLHTEPERCLSGQTGATTSGLSSSLMG